MKTAFLVLADGLMASACGVLSCGIGFGIVVLLIQIGVI